MKLYKIGFRKYIICVDYSYDVKEVSEGLQKSFPKIKFVVLKE